MVLGHMSMYFHMTGFYMYKQNLSQFRKEDLFCVFSDVITPAIKDLGFHADNNTLSL